jgi:hypothetical protein
MVVKGIMMGNQMHVEGPVNKAPEKLAASKRFGRYKREGQKRSSLPESLKDDERLMTRILEIYSECVAESYGFIWNLSDATKRVLKRHGARFDASEIERFSLAMVDFPRISADPFVGSTFLTALIAFGKDKDYTVHTSHLPPLKEFGSMLRNRRVTVEGDLGNYVGFEMGGGADPSSTVIIVNGNVGQCCGKDMLSGEIHVNGEIESLGKPVRGRIYHKGKLIVDK